MIYFRCLHIMKCPLGPPPSCLSPGAHLSRATRPPTAVDVCLPIWRCVQHHDQLNAADVQPAGRNVSGHKGVELTGLEALQSLLTCALRHVSMKTSCSHPVHNIGAGFPQTIWILSSQICNLCCFRTVSLPSVRESDCKVVCVSLCVGEHYGAPPLGRE